VEKKVKFRVTIAATIEARDEAEAQRAVKEVESLLAKPYLTALLAGKGINVKSYAVNPKAEKLG
jgi:hypothetical protein